MDRRYCSRNADAVEIPEVTAMGWTMQQILDNADELAERFEAFDPSLAEEVPVHEYELRRAARATRRRHSHIVGAVATAREAGTTWTRIGEILGISGPEAERCYDSASEPLESSGPGRA